MPAPPPRLSSKLIHGGLRYLERPSSGLCANPWSSAPRLLKTAPHLVAPLRFLLPIYRWQKRQALMLRAGLALYDVLSFGDGLPASGRLDDDDIAATSQAPPRGAHLGSPLLRLHDRRRAG